MTTSHLYYFPSDNFPSLSLPQCLAPLAYSSCGQMYAKLLIRLCPLVAPLIFIFSRSMRNASLFGYILNIYVLLKNIEKRFRLIPWAVYRNKSNKNYSKVLSSQKFRPRNLIRRFKSESWAQISQYTFNSGS